MSYQILDEYTEAMYDKCAQEWLEAVKKGDLEKERSLSACMDICDWSLTQYETESFVNNQNWKIGMK